MKPRPLGRSGMKMSALAPGTMNFGSPTGRNAALQIIDAAIDGDFNHFLFKTENTDSHA